MKQRDLRNSLKSREAKIAAELKNLPPAASPSRSRSASPRRRKRPSKWDTTTTDDDAKGYVSLVLAWSLLFFSFSPRLESHPQSCPPLARCPLKKKPVNPLNASSAKVRSSGHRSSNASSQGNHRSSNDRSSPLKD